MAVIGSGPAGFYTAYRVMSKIPRAKVDMYEALPVPFGLVRFGVAPDHPEVKNCQDKFEEVASWPNFTFIGNVSVGHASDRPDGCHVPVASILRHYDAVVFSYGAAKDRLLGIPGETTLKGVHSARQFVAWYNGLPEFADLAPDLTKGDEAVVIGQGNVALDVARMLLEDVDVLRKTDITEHALAALSKSRIKRVHVVGRRGPMQAAFTIKEVRELMKLPDTAFQPVDASLVPSDLKSLERPKKRLMEVLLKGSSVSPPGKRSWSLDFCLSPSRFLPRKSDASSIGYTELNETELASPFDPNSKVTTTDSTTVLPSDIVFRSIGYKSIALPGFQELGIPFDDRNGIIENDTLGRVRRVVSHHPPLHQHFPGLYCAGWVKRGPTGVIASTMEDAFATGDAIVRDWTTEIPFLPDDDVGGDSAGWDAVRQEVKSQKAAPVSWADWRMIDAREREMGKGKDKEREKFTTTKDMLSVVQ